jgi:hypothetical protein
MMQNNSGWALSEELCGTNGWVLPDYEVVNGNVEIYLVKLNYKKDGSLDLDTESESITVTLDEKDLLEMLSDLRGEDNETY